VSWRNVSEIGARSTIIANWHIAKLGGTEAIVSVTSFHVWMGEIQSQRAMKVSLEYNDVGRRNSLILKLKIYERKEGEKGTEEKGNGRRRCLMKIILIDAESIDPKRMHCYSRALSPFELGKLSDDLDGIHLLPIKFLIL